MFKESFGESPNFKFETSSCWLLKAAGTVDTRMFQEVTKRLLGELQLQYTHLWLSPIYQPFTNFLGTSS